MKTVRLFTWMLLASVFAGRAQTDELLVHFSGRQIEDYIHLNFTVKGGITCLGTEVQRSNDNIHFETIGLIPGICGNSENEESYSFDDFQPLPNADNYYRIDFGNYGLSSSIAVRFTDYGDDVVVFPQPVYETATVYYPHQQGETVAAFLYHASGALVSLLESNTDHFVFQRRGLPSGIYFILLRYDSGEVRSATLILA